MLTGGILDNTNNDDNSEGDGNNSYGDVTDGDRSEQDESGF